MKSYSIVLWFVADTLWFVQSKDKSCITPELPKYSKPISREQDTYEHNSIFYYRCAENYHFERNAERHKIVCNNGQWHPMNLWKCFDICNNTCGDHGTCHKTVGSTVTETLTRCLCDKNYVGKHCDARVCESEPVALHHLQPVLLYGTVVSGKYSLGSVLQYKCVKNYIIKNGLSSAKCESHGWNPPTIPQCEVNTCPGLEFPNGDYVPTRRSYSPQETVSFQCYSGYSLHGEPSATCTNGYWSPNWPNCVNTCHRQPFPHGDFHPSQSSYTSGESINFRCHNRFKLSGKPEVFCDKGDWSDQWPSCLPIYPSCGKPPDVQHAKPMYSGYNVGDTVTYMCDKGYQLDGKMKIICVDNGNDQPKWEKAPRCVQLPCGSNSKILTKRGTKYSCQSKASITTTVTSTVKPLTIVTATAGALLLLLLIVISLVAYQRRRIAINNRRQGRERLTNEDDRYSFVYYSNDVHVVLPSYDEAIRVQGAPPPYQMETAAANPSRIESGSNDPDRQDVSTTSSCNPSATEVIYDAIDETLLAANYIQGQSINEPHSSSRHAASSNETNEIHNSSTDRQNTNISSYKEIDSELDNDNGVNCVNNRDSNIYNDNNSVDSASTFSFVCDTTQLLDD